MSRSKRVFVSWKERKEVFVKVTYFLSIVPGYTIWSFAEDPTTRSLWIVYCYYQLVAWRVARRFGSQSVDAPSERQDWLWEEEEIPTAEYCGGWIGRVHGSQQREFPIVDPYFNWRLFSPSWGLKYPCWLFKPVSNDHPAGSMDELREYKKY